MLTNQVSGVDIQLRLRYSKSLKPCELQKLIPYHQVSFCWIYLLLLTLLTISSSWPPCHHWTSQRSHFAGLNPMSMAGLSNRPWEGRYPQNISWSLGFLRDRFLDPSSSPHTLHHWVPSYRHMVSHTIAYADDTQLYLSFRPDNPTVAARISGCLADISAWMKEHHLQFNLAKTELLVFPVTPTLQHDHPARFFYNYPIKFSQKSWCNFRWLSKTTLQKLLDLAGSHCTTSERSGPSLHSMQHNLSRPLSFQDFTTVMLF